MLGGHTVGLEWDWTELDWKDWLTLSDCLRAQARPRRIPIALTFYFYINLIAANISSRLHGKNGRKRVSDLCKHQVP